MSSPSRDGDQSVDRQQSDDENNETNSNNATPEGSPVRTPSPSTQDAAVPKWAAYLDDEGRTYYYNSVSGESAWEPPTDEPYVPLQTEQEPTAAVAAEGGGTPDAEEQPEPSSSTPPTSPAAADEAGGSGGSDWVSYRDDSGLEYFYNSVTQETQWERPEGMPIVATASTTDTGDVAAGETATAEDVTAETTKSVETSQTTAQDTDAVSEVQKENPVEEEVVVEEEEKEEEEDPTEIALRTANTALESPDSIFEPTCVQKVGTVIELLGAQEGSNAMKKIVSSYRGHTAVCGLLAHWLTELTSTSSSSASNNNAASADNKNTSTTNTLATNNVTDPKSKTAETVRTISEDAIHRIARGRFTKAGGEELLQQMTSSDDKKKARFLKDMIDTMIDDDPWRRLLIDLSAKNKDSALLNGCLQKISKRGYNREISKRINQSDYFGVFNAMLGSELSIVGKIAVGGVSYASGNSNDHDGNSGTGDNNNNTKSDADIEAMNDIDDLVSNLKRICATTSYTYLYTNQCLEELVLRGTRLQKKLPEDSPKAIGLERAVRKWERLREELEEELVSSSSSSKRSSGGAGKGESHMTKRRRIDLGLTMSDLYQRQRRRKKSKTDDGSKKDEDNGDSDTNNSTNITTITRTPLQEQPLDTATIELIKRHSMNMQIDENLVDRLLVPHTLLPGQRRSIGELLIAHPCSIKVLLANLFQPGSSSRIMSITLKQKFSKLLAKAIISSRKSFGAMLEENGISGSSTSEDEEEMTLWKMILQGSQLCKEVENSVTFTVLNYSRDNIPPEIPSNSSVGGKLSYIAIRSALTAQGILLWIDGLTNSAEFVASAAYPTLSPSLLGLARIIAIHHPFTRQTVLDVTIAFLRHKPPELSFGKKRALNQQVMRLFLWLSTLGRQVTLGVFETVIRQLEDGGGAIDSSLLRYFLGGVMDIVRPPLSAPFVKVLSKMFATQACIDAMKSPHFPDNKKVLLRNLLGEFDKTIMEEKQKKSSSCFVSADDVALVISLKSMYGR